MQQIHYIKGVKVQKPVNFPDLYLQVQRDSDGLDQSTSIKRFEWIDYEASLLRSYFDAGMTGDTGVTAGLAHKIELVENGLKLTIFDGYIDLQTARFEQDLCVVDSVPKASIDWLDSGVADGIDFNNLFDKKIIKDSDFVYVPYVLTSIPNHTELMLISLTTTFVLLSLAKQIIMFAKASGESGSIIDSVGGILELIAEILYTITLILALIKLILDLVDLIIQKIKYKPAMSINRHFEIACNQLGLTYSSPLLNNAVWKKAHIIPASFSNIENQTDDRILGFFKPSPNNDQTGFYKGTFADLIRELRTLLNVRVRINGTNLQIVLDNDTVVGSRFKLPPVRNTAFETNANEIISNYNISFSYDVTDKNTINTWQGNNVQVSLSYIKKPSNKLFYLLKGFEQRQSRFARGIKKKTLTGPEKAVSGLYKSIAGPLGTLVKAGNGVVKVINKALDFIENIIKKLKTIGIDIPFDPPRPQKIKSPPTDDVIENRIGMLALEKDLFTVDKLVMLDVNSDPEKTKLANENEIIINAEYIYSNYHKSNSFAPSKDSAQRFIYQYENIQMNLEDYRNVKEDGYVKLSNGTVCKVLSFEFNPQDRLAKFVIEERKLYTNNIEETIISPIGR